MIRRSFIMAAAEHQAERLGGVVVRVKAQANLQNPGRDATIPTNDIKTGIGL